MNRKGRRCSAAGMPIRVTSSAVLASVALWVLLYAAATRLPRLPAKQAAPASLAAVLLHWASVLAHHAGHATASRTTGFTMSGVRLWGLLGSSLYPADEPPLPTAIHVRRALGGPVASLALGGALVALWSSACQPPTEHPDGTRRKTRALRCRWAGAPPSGSTAVASSSIGYPPGARSEAVARPLAAARGPQGGGGWEIARLLIAFAMLDNLLFLGLGSFLPFGFTDGSTLLRLWQERAR